MTPLTIARRLIARAEKRARTCGGKPHEYVTETLYQELKAACAPKPRKGKRNA